MGLTHVEVVSGQGSGTAQPLDVALIDDVTTCRAGSRAEVDDVVGGGDDVGVVLDDQHGVALVA